MPIEELKAKATDLGIEFDEDVEEDSLNALISEKEEELSSDLDYLKEQLAKYKTEAKKAFEKRDAATRDKRKLSQKVKDLEDLMKDTVDKSKLEELQNSLSELKKFKEEADKRAEEEELKTLDEVERNRIKFEKQIADMKKDMDNMRSSFQKEKEEVLNREKEQFRTIERLRGVRLESDILRAASKYNAYNPDQIVALTKGFFTYDDQLEKYSHFVRDKDNKLVDEMTVEEYIKSFLGKEENENLVKSSATKTGFDTKTQNRSDTSDNKTSKSTGKGKYKADDPQIIEEAAEKNLDPVDWARIKEKQENKLSSMRTNS